VELRADVESRLFLLPWLLTLPSLTKIKGKLNGGGQEPPPYICGSIVKFLSNKGVNRGQIACLGHFSRYDFISV
jgi:hypothetical protein